MSFLREALRDKPVNLHMMDDTAPFQDYSGYNRTASQEGSTAALKHVSVVASASYSPVFTPSKGAAFSTPVFRRGFESSPFTLELWYKPTTPGALQQVLSNFGAFDGITAEGTKIYFGTRYASASNAIVSYNTQELKTVHIVGVHTEKKNSLYIDGLLVGEVSLDSIGQSERYSNGNGILYSGGGSSPNQSFAIGGVAIYAKALSPEIIKRHYDAGSKSLRSEEIVSSFGGVVMPLSLKNSNILIDQWWSTEEDWRSGLLFNTSVVRETLVPQTNEAEVSLPGQWLSCFALDSAEDTSIFGVSANWNGTGVTVEASLDGVTWETMIRGKNIALIPQGFNPQGKLLQVRVTFPGGILKDTSYIDELNLVSTKAAATPQYMGRTMTLYKASQEREYPLRQYHDNWGVMVEDTGFLQVSADISSEASPIRTVEVWFKANATNFGANFGAGTYYVNGAPGTGFVVGEWNVTHYVANANHVGDLFFNNAAQIGHVAIYPTALTATQIANIYAKYMETSLLTVNDSSNLQVTEISPAATVYAFDWSIQSGG